MLGGIQAGINALDSHPNHSSTLIVATDASAQQGDVDGIISSAQANNVTVHVLLTGDCGLASSSSASVSTRALLAPEELTSNISSSGYLSSQIVLRRIAEETGGKYFYMPGGSQTDFETVVTEVFEYTDSIVDTDPPFIEVQATPDLIWPPNHEMVEVTPFVQAVDNVDPDPIIEFVGVTISEPYNGQGDGNTDSDFNVTSDGRIFVRAERSGKGYGRIYTITYKATDDSGNTAFGSATVTVPHNIK